MPHAMLRANNNDHATPTWTPPAMHRFSPPVLLSELPVQLARRYGTVQGPSTGALVLQCAEQAAARFLESVGLIELDQRAGPAVIRSTCVALRPSGLPAAVELRLYATRLGRSSLETRAELVDPADGVTILATAEVMFAWMDFARGATVALPAALVAAVRELDEAAGELALAA
jgi:acyl-CoA thioesterase FadM